MLISKARRRATPLLLAIPATLAVLASLHPASASAAPTAKAAKAAKAAVPAYCHSGGAKLWENLATCGWPNSANTGPELAKCRGGRLTQHGNGTTPIVLSTANEVVNCTDLRGPVEITAAGVTIKNSMVTVKNGTGVSGSAAVTLEVGSSATISHVAVDGGNSVHACLWHEGTQLQATAVNCYGVNDAIFAWATTNPSTGGSNYTITDSYFHDFTQATANGHDDGFQTEGSSHGLISHNTFRMTLNSTSAISVWDSRADSNDITVSDNLIAGGGFSVYAEDYNPGDGAPSNPSPVGGFSVTNIQFDNNSFSTILSGCVGKYGVWFTRPSWEPYHGGPTDGWHRIGNVVLETGENVDNGNPHSNGKLCG
ncbi:MAG TPA: hypothetical protein VGM14_12645 [Streptosporangiaceae bacterium]|jgi:hypothetical protein